MRTPTLVVALGALLFVPGVLAGQSHTADPVAEIANVRFYSDLLPNMHHALYAAAWARRPPGSRSLAGRLPAPLDAPMSAEERTAWDAAIDYYDKQLASRDLLFGEGMTALKTALAAGDLAGAAVGAELRSVLESVMPIYRRYLWPEHDRANRAWIAATVDRMKAIAPDTIPRLEKLYGVSWFSSPVRADIVWVGNWAGAYATTRPPHATISLRDTEWGAVESVFHEFSHVLVHPLQNQLAQALGERLRDHRDLWHALQFYITGAAVRDVLKARAIDYTPHIYSYGLFDRGWGRYRTALETHFEPYVQGKTTLDDAMAGLLKMLEASTK